MSKWIDADALKQKYTMATTRYSGGIMERPVVVLEAIDDAPSIEIIRCGECKYWKSTVQMPNGTEVKCLYGRKPDDFCSYGQKGDENVETD